MDNMTSGGDNKRTNRLRNGVLTAIALLLLTASIYSIIPWDVALPDMQQNTPDAALSATDVSVTDAPKEIIRWVGSQKGSVRSDGSDMYASLAEDGSEASEVIHTAQSGDTAIAIERVGDWMRVRVGCHTGWMNRRALDMDGEIHKYIAASDSDAEIIPISDSDARSALDSICAEYSCTGVTAAVIENGEVRYTYEYGYANRKKETPMTADTKIRIASISKIVIGMTAMSMSEQDMISLDKDVSDYLGYKVRNPRFDTDITMRSLLTHTSSIKEVKLDATDTSSLKKKLSKDNSYSGNRPGLPGSFSYCNAGINTAAAAMEKVADMTMVDYIDSYFFDVMGVDASFHAKNIDDRDRIATLYNDNGSTESVKDLLERPLYDKPGDNFSLYAGGLVISAKDMARMLCILIGDGMYHDIYYLSPQSVEEMETRAFNVVDFDQ
ncbi:MAG: beta-lactamase family protein, partial [Clostridia bacterium]|nr:beta-lactamase family protein [Clostridia bacterium]